MKKSIIKSIFLAVIVAVLIPSLSFGSTKVEIGTLTIPKFNKSSSIVKTNTLAGLGKDLWHRGNGSPEASSTFNNFVLAGHRTSLGQNTLFTKLPEMKKGDKVELALGDKKYTYVVTGTEVVPPTAINIEFNTSKKMLTMYTCVYSHSGKNRFVVYAEQVENM
jgi:sortase A